MSDPAAADGPSVAVDRLDAVCLVAPDQPAESVRWQIDRVARTRLEASLAQAMHRLVAADDSSVWLIRELEADVALGVDDSSDDGLAREWADGIVRALAETLAAGADGDRVIRFPSRGAFLARFASDVVAGAAWQSWWYASLEPLRRLPAGTAVREALTATPADGAEALALLVGQRAFERVLEAFSERDAHVVLASCFPDQRRPRAPVGTELAASVLSAIALLPSDEPPVSSKNVLRITLAAGGAGAPPSRWLTERLLALVALARALGAEDCVRALRANDTTQLVDAAHFDSAVLALLPDLVQLAAQEPSLVARAASVVEPGAQAVHTGSTLLTEFGGAFLLLPAALELDVPRLVGDAAALRLQVFARCVGASDPAAASDPGLLLACGADAPWLDPTAELDPAVARLLLERLVRLGRVEGRCLVAELAPTPHGAALVLRDATRDSWAYAARADDPRVALERGLRLVREASELRCECLLLGPGLEILGDEVEAEAVATREDLGAPPAELARWLAHARSPDDLESLSLLGTPPTPDLTWSLVAHAIVRGFSGRLHGFDLSGVGYLQQNFLRTRATIRLAEGAIEVELARSPLQVVLQLAGFGHKIVNVPWLGAELTVRLGDD